VTALGKDLKNTPSAVYAVVGNPSRSVRNSPRHRSEGLVASGILPDVEGGILPPGLSVRILEAPLHGRAFCPPGGTPDSTAGRMPAATRLCAVPPRHRCQSAGL